MRSLIHLVLTYISPIVDAHSFFFFCLSGPCHGDELAYIFHVDFLSRMDPKSPEMRTVEQVVQLWTNFSKTG
jgi:hypothetical protein